MSKLSMKEIDAIEIHTNMMIKCKGQDTRFCDYVISIAQVRTLISEARVAQTVRERVEVYDNHKGNGVGQYGKDVAEWSVLQLVDDLRTILIGEKGGE